MLVPTGQPKENQNMTDAPEKIALRWTEGAAVTSGQLMDSDTHTKYIREDVALAMVQKARDEAMDEAAKLCEQYAMSTVTNHKDAQYCGCYVGEYVDGGFTGKHQGMAYAEAIRALKGQNDD